MAAAIKEKHAGKKIIVSVDVLQRLSGGSLRLHAYEKLLCDNQSLVVSNVAESSSANPNLTDGPRRRTSSIIATIGVSGVVLIDRVIRNNSRPQDEETTSREMRDAAEKLNEKIEGAVD